MQSVRQRSKSSTSAPFATMRNSRQRGRRRRSDLLPNLVWPNNKRATIKKKKEKKTNKIATRVRRLITRMGRPMVFEQWHCSRWAMQSAPAWVTCRRVTHLALNDRKTGAFSNRRSPWNRINPVSMSRWLAVDLCARLLTNILFLSDIFYVASRKTFELCAQKRKRAGSARGVKMSDFRTRRPPMTRTPIWPSALRWRRRQTPLRR